MLPLTLIAVQQLQDPFAGAQWLTVPRTTAPIERADWIWVHTLGSTVPTAQNASVGTVRLTKRWTLAQKPTTATAWFTADNSSRVTINGHLVGTSDRWETIETVDITTFLTAGDNVIEIDATNGPGTGATNPGGMLFAAEAQDANGNFETVVTDDTWQSPNGTVVRLGDYATPPWSKSGQEVPAPVFEGRFQSDKQIKSARARIVGLGHFDLYINGKRQGDAYLNQPWSQFDKTIYWHEFDVTQSVRQGSNTVEAVMGNSFYRVAQTPGRFAKGDAMPDYSNGLPYLLTMVLDITYTDGTTRKVVTDETWTWKKSPYTYSHVYGGEDYDARILHQPREPKPVALAPAPKAELLPITWPLLKAQRVDAPSRVFEYKPGVWTYVFPQNGMATVRLRVRGKAGQKIEITPSEVMSPEGEVQQLNLWGGHSYTTYTLAGTGSEEHDWRFFYHGFQFVQLKGGVPVGQPNPDGLPVVESLELVHLRTDNPETGHFTTSKDLYNKTHDLIDWAMRSNMAYSLTDCPHREKLGWLECTHLLFRTFAYRYDAQAWFHKITRDIRDIQLPDGRITTVAPDYLMLPPSSPYKFTIEWGAAGVLLPWQAYEWYGDSRFLTENYAMMKAFVDWIDTNAVDGIAPAGLGDWYDYGHGQSPGPSRFTPTDQTATAMAALCAQAMVKAASVLENEEDEAKYTAIYDRFRTAFQEKFYDPATKIVKNNGSCQTSNAMALCADLIPQADRQAALDAIIRDLESRDYQQTSGDVGHLFFIRALAEGGRSDVLHKVYSRTGLGSYGGILAKGLTTMPETWDAITVGSNSLNHCMLGHAMEWFYGWVLGIRQAPGSVGWDFLVIAPEPGDLTSASGKILTPKGEISVEWSLIDGKFTANVTVPEGTTASFVVPVSATSVTINGERTFVTPGIFRRPIVTLPAGTSRLACR